MPQATSAIKKAILEVALGIAAHLIADSLHDWMPKAIEWLGAFAT